MISRGDENNLMPMLYFITKHRPIYVRFTRAPLTNQHAVEKPADQIQSLLHLFRFKVVTASKDFVYIQSFALSFNGSQNIS